MVDNGPEVMTSQLQHALATELPITLIALKKIVLTITVLVLLEGTVLIPLCGFMMYLAVKSVMNTRISLFSVFLLLPR
jgi:hypothetical protein